MNPGNEERPPFLELPDRLWLAAYAGESGLLSPSDVAAIRAAAELLEELSWRLEETRGRFSGDA